MEDREEWVSRCVNELEEVKEKLFSLYVQFMLARENNDGLTHAQGTLLKYLIDNENSTVSALADYMGVTMAAVSSMVDRLVKSGLLNRVRSEIDRRVVYVSLTPEGREVIRGYQKRQRERTAFLIDKMGRENANLFLAAQRMMLDTLEQVMKDKCNREETDATKY